MRRVLTLLKSSIKDTTQLSRFSSNSQLLFSKSYLYKAFGTLHEESAGGINGRLARFAHLHSPSTSPTELLSFYNRLGPADRSQLNISSYNFILSALLQSGQQMEAFRLINQLEGSLAGFPDKSTFTVLMRGLVEADNSGSLALAADEIFELMQKRFNIPANLELWSLRIRAFLHSKFLNHPSQPNLEPARIFYHEMLEYFDNSHHQFALNELRSELIVTAVTRRLWSFAEWMLLELENSSSTAATTATTNGNTNNYALHAYHDKIANSSGLFLDSASIPILRKLIKNKPMDSVINSFGFHRSVLLYCWRQGRISADLALNSLKFLIKFYPNHSDWWIDTAEGCLRRELPRDYYVFEGDEIKDRFITTVQRVKCSDDAIKELESEIMHQKLLL